MADDSNITEYRDFGCVFRYDQDANILHVRGDVDEGRVGILKLQRQGWLRKTLNAVWFSGDPAILYTGSYLNMYLAEVSVSPPPMLAPVRSFKDIVNGTGNIQVDQ